MKGETGIQESQQPNFSLFVALNMTRYDFICVMNLAKVEYRCGCVTEDFSDGVKISP